MKRFHRVAVLMGGPSSEREVSLRSGQAVAEALREGGYDVQAVDVTDRSLALPAGIEAVFIALHGAYGEDGTVQEELGRRGIPYTGPGPEASRNAFDKEATKRLLRAAGIPTAAYEQLRPGAGHTLPLPLVVKPAREGSSIGIHRVFREEEWAPALEDAFRHDDKVFAEAYIPGRELTVGVLDDRVLPIVEIVAPDGWYDYGSKYTRGACRYLVPAPVTDAERVAAQDWARRAFDTLGCRGMSRVDFRMTTGGELFVLEINTIPGCTETSLLPKAAAADGLPFPALCELILSRATV